MCQYLHTIYAPCSHCTLTLKICLSPKPPLPTSMQPKPTTKLTSAPTNTKHDSTTAAQTPPLILAKTCPSIIHEPDRHATSRQCPSCARGDPRNETNTGHRHRMDYATEASKTGHKASGVTVSAAPPWMLKTGTLGGEMPVAEAGPPSVSAWTNRLGGAVRGLKVGAKRGEIPWKMEDAVEGACAETTGTPVAGSEVPAETVEVPAETLKLAAETLKLADNAKVTDDGDKKKGRTMGRPDSAYIAPWKRATLTSSSPTTKTSVPQSSTIPRILKRSNEGSDGSKQFSGATEQNKEKTGEQQRQSHGDDKGGIDKGGIDKGGSDKGGRGGTWKTGRHRGTRGEEKGSIRKSEKDSVKKENKSAWQW